MAERADETKDQW